MTSRTTYGMSKCYKCNKFFSSVKLYTLDGLPTWVSNWIELIVIFDFATLRSRPNDFICAECWQKALSSAKHLGVLLYKLDIGPRDE